MTYTGEAGNIRLGPDVHQGERGENALIKWKPMVEVRSLGKYYGHFRALRGVSFSIRPGEILGYLGSNGAGKSTTVRMLVGIADPSEGEILFNGRTIREDLAGWQRRIGYVPEDAHLYPHLTGWEYLQLVGRLRGMPSDVLEPRIAEFLRLFSLGEERHDPLSSYSKGMRQKILLSAALLHNPDVLLLDEPFSGLDVDSALMLRAVIRKLAEEGKAIFFSSHVLEVVEKVCTSVLILRKGEMVAYDSIERLRELTIQPSLEGVFSQLTEVRDSEATADGVLRAMKTGTAAAPSPGRSNPFGDLWRDARTAVRSLLSSMGFTIVALLSLALGICIGTCGFSEMRGIALKTVPGVANPGELAALQSPISYPAYRRVTEKGGVRAVRGGFAATPGTGLSVVVSDRYWRDRLHMDPSFPGGTIQVNGRTCVVAGIEPPGFVGASPFLFPADLWVSTDTGRAIAPELAGGALERPDAALFFFTGRLRAGVGERRAESELDATLRRFDAETSGAGRESKERRAVLVQGGRVFPLAKSDLPFFTSFFTVMGVLIMGIACADVANMALARAMRRRKEIALTMSLTGLLTAFRWQSLFPEPGDYRTLGSLPLRSWQLFGAKLAALLLVASCAVGAVAALPSVLFPALSSGRWALQPSLGVRVAAHAGASIAAGAFTFLAVVALQGILLNSLRPGAFARLAGHAQGVLVAAMAGCSILSFSIDGRFVAPGWFPPVWFLDLYRALSGDTGDARRAQIALATAAGLTAGLYLLSYARSRTLFLETPGSRRRGGAGLRVVERVSVWLGGTPGMKAILSFLARTMSRNVRHRTAAMAYAGLGVALLLSGVQMMGLAAGADRLIAADFLYYHMLATVLFVGGTRQLFAQPVEVRANWIFQSLEAVGRDEWLDAVDRFGWFWGAALLCAPLPLEIHLIGGRAVAEMGLSLAVGFCAWEGAYYYWDRLPFTCSKQPGGIPPQVVLGFFGLLAGLAVLHMALLTIVYSPRVLAFALAALTWCGYRLRKNRMEFRVAMRLNYRETVEPAVRALELR